MFSSLLHKIEVLATEWKAWVQKKTQIPKQLEIIQLRFWKLPSDTEVPLHTIGTRLP